MISWARSDPLLKRPINMWQYTRDEPKKKRRYIYINAFTHIQYVRCVHYRMWTATSKLWMKEQQQQQPKKIVVRAVNWNCCVQEMESWQKKEVEISASTKLTISANLFPSHFFFLRFGRCCSCAMPECVFNCHQIDDSVQFF